MKYLRVYLTNREKEWFNPIMMDKFIIFFMFFRRTTRFKLDFLNLLKIQLTLKITKAFIRFPVHAVKFI